MFQQSYHLCHSVIDSACVYVRACASVCVLMRVCVCVRRPIISGSAPLLDPLVITTLSWMIYSSLWISCVSAEEHGRIIEPCILECPFICFRNLRLAWGWIHNLHWSPAIIFLYVILISFNSDSPVWTLHHYVATVGVGNTPGLTIARAFKLLFSGETASWLSSFISVLFHIWLEAFEAVICGGASRNVSRVEWMCKFLAAKAVADSDGDALLAYFPPPCITSLKCTLTPLITSSLHLFQKMMRAAFYLGNRERNCQTARCCPDRCTLCPYFISFSQELFLWIQSPCRFQQWRLWFRPNLLDF